MQEFKNIKSKEELENSIEEHNRIMEQYEDELKQLNKYNYSPILYNYIEFDEIGDTGIEVIELMNDLQTDINNKNNISEDIDCLIENLIKWKKELTTKFKNELEDNEELGYFLAKEIILRNKE